MLPPATGYDAPMRNLMPFLVVATLASCGGGKKKEWYCFTLQGGLGVCADDAKRCDAMREQGDPACIAETDVSCFDVVYSDERGTESKCLSPSRMCDSLRAGYADNAGVSRVGPCETQ